MLALENADEILQILDRFTKQKSKDIPAELEEYINYVAKTGDTVYRWPTVQYLFREKLRNVIKDFHDTTASIEDLPQCPNVDQFNYESMKTLLFERFDSFQAAPFTIQRLCELLTDPKKHYSRLDKFMRALEKNILVVSTVLPGRKPTEESPDKTMLIDPILPGMKIDDLNKSTEKRYGNDNHVEQNGPSENHIEVNSKEPTIVEATPSSSNSHASSDNDVKTDEEDTIVKETIPEKSTETEKPAPDVKQPTAEKETEKPANTVEPVETKPIEKPDEVEPEKMDSDDPKADKAENKIDESAKIDETKTETKEEESITSTLSEEKKVDEEIKETPSSDAPIVSDKPSTPKRAASDDDDDDADNAINNHNAKKIRLELEENGKAEPVTESSAKPIVAEAEDSQKQKEQNVEKDAIDAIKEKELLDVVDSALTAENDSIIADAKPSDENVVASETSKVTEEPPVSSNDVVKSDDEPVTTSIPADLDFTPDEALNELVSADILSVIPEQPAEEVKMSEEPADTAETAEAAVAASDEMTVENTEPNALEAENAMEAAPIKTDEEKMDVDESNSVDAMDL